MTNLLFWATRLGRPPAQMTGEHRRNRLAPAAVSPAAKRSPSPIAARALVPGVEEAAQRVAQAVEEGAQRITPAVEEAAWRVTPAVEEGAQRPSRDPGARIDLRGALVSRRR
jgi:hypothetical protein